MKWVAEFNIPDGNLIGAAVAKTCPNDNKIRDEKDYKDVYAMTIPKDEYLRRKDSIDNFQRIKNMTKEELADFLYQVELGDVDFAITFCDLCEKDHNGNCEREKCVRAWLDFDSKKHPQGIDHWRKDDEN